MLFEQCKANKGVAITVGYDPMAAEFKAVVIKADGQKMFHNSDAGTVYAEVKKYLGGAERNSLLAFRGMAKTMQVNLKLMNLQRRSMIPVLKSDASKLKAEKSDKSEKGGVEAAVKKAAKVVKKVAKKK